MEGVSKSALALSSEGWGADLIDLLSGGIPGRRRGFGKGGYTLYENLSRRCSSDA